MHVKYYSSNDICMAVLPYTEALEPSFFSTIIGRHIEKYLSYSKANICAVYIYSTPIDGQRSRIKFILDVIKQYQIECCFENILEFRICNSCNQVCKIGYPITNINEICNVFGWDCMSCMDSY